MVSRKKLLEGKLATVREMACVQNLENVNKRGRCVNLLIGLNGIILLYLIEKRKCM
jgi:hypothetical protein